MTSAYRRDHEPFPRNDEFERLGPEQREDIVDLVTLFEERYPTPVASSGERAALRRAMARFLIDSGKYDLDATPGNWLFPDDVLELSGDANSANDVQEV